MQLPLYRVKGYLPVAYSQGRWFNPLVPSLEARSIDELDIELLVAQHDLKAFGLDVDSTLAKHGDTQFHPAVEEFMLDFRDRLAPELGVELRLISNTTQERMEQLESYFGIRTIHIPQTRKKPDPEVIYNLAQDVGCEPRQVCVVDDRRDTGIAAGNWAGALTVLVEPFPGETRWVHAGRRIGEAFYELWHK